MTDELHDQLTEIHGIGDAKADEVLDVLAHHTPDTNDDVQDLLEQALDYHQAGDHAYAAKYVRQAHDHLTDT